MYGLEKAVEKDRSNDSFNTIGYTKKYETFHLWKDCHDLETSPNEDTKERVRLWESNAQKQYKS